MPFLLFPDDDADTIPLYETKRKFRRNIKVMGILERINAMSSLQNTQNNNRMRGKIAINEDVANAFSIIGKVLLDFSRINNRIILPEFGEELQLTIAQLITAYIAKKPIQIFTPFCPDWSRDQSGKYDFKSLGGGVSFIAQKVFNESPQFLEILNKHNIPYEGILVFANWGLETEINAKDTYGRKLSPDDVKMCFSSTHALTDETLRKLQNSLEGNIFKNYKVIPMTEFFIQQGIDPNILYKEAYDFFSNDKKGKKLVEQLHKDSLSLNKQRLGLDEEQNYTQTLQNCAEYAVFGYALGERGIIMAAESRTTSRAYNLFRNFKRKEIMPLFYLKGIIGANEGVNIL